MNYNTLKCRINGRVCRADTLANGRNLNYNEEALLTEWILDLASRGFLPRKWIVEDTANIILLLKNKKLVGKKWFQRYIERTPEVQIAQSKKYDYQRAKQEDPEVI